jgi:hypothetical protein
MDRDRKGFLSLILVMAFVSSIFILYAIYASISLRNDSVESEMLKLTLYSTHEIEAKRALLNMIVHEGRKAIIEEGTRIGINVVFANPATVKEALKELSGDRLTASIGTGLGRRERALEDMFAQEGIDVDFWCGTITEEERHSLPQQMLTAGRTLCPTPRPGRCFDLDTPANRKEGDEMNTVTVCTGLLTAAIDPTTPSVKAKITQFDSRVTPSITPIGSYVFGVSILDKKKNIASVVTIPVDSNIEIYTVGS